MAQNKITSRNRARHTRFYFREWRKHRGLNQEDLAEMVGMTASSISQIETGKQGFTDTTLTNLADALGCSPGDLLARNPLDKESPWPLWDSFQRAEPSKKREIVAVVETMLHASKGH